MMRQNLSLGLPTKRDFNQALQLQRLKTVSLLVASLDMILSIEQMSKALIILYCADAQTGLRQSCSQTSRTDFLASCGIFYNVIN